MNSNLTYSYTHLADVYGAGVYSCGQFEQGCTQTTGAPGAPDTGFFGQPAYVVYPTLLAVAVVVGTVTFLISRKLRSRKQK